jgi:hypothetical protein
MKKVFIINGSAGVGKDTFVEIARHYFFIKKHLTTYNISSVDNVKNAAKILGWDGEKNEKGRKFLSDLKDLSTINYQGPYQYMSKEVKSKNKGVFFLHIREPSEISFFKEQYPTAKTLLIKRDGLQKFDNHADNDVNLYPYDEIINNSGTIEDLVETIKLFVNENINGLQ